MTTMAAPQKLLVGLEIGRRVRFGEASWSAYWSAMAAQGLLSHLGPMEMVKTGKVTTARGDGLPLLEIPVVNPLLMSK